MGLSAGCVSTDYATTSGKEKDERDKRDEKIAVYRTRAHSIENVKIGFLKKGKKSVRKDRIGSDAASG
jgi:hypothetical protein